MFFRIYFLYLTKLWWVGFVLVIAGMLGREADWATVVKLIGLAIVVSLGVLGALLAIPYGFLKRPIRCPICGTPGAIAFVGRSPGVECRPCGFVYCKNPLLSFQVLVTPWEDEPEPDEE